MTLAMRIYSLNGACNMARHSIGTLLAYVNRFTGTSIRLVSGPQIEGWYLPSTIMASKLSRDRDCGTVPRDITTFPSHVQ